MSVKSSQDALRSGAARSTFVIFACMSLWIPPLFVFAALRTGNGWREAAWGLAAPAFLVLWVSAFKVDMSRGVLSYRTLFRGSRSLPISAIESAEWAMRSDAPFGPLVQLRLNSENSGARPLVINAKVFARADLDRLIEILRPKVKGSKPY
jgi:hypothetical protein